MKQNVEVFEVTRAQLDYWRYCCDSAFEYALDDDTDLMSVYVSQLSSGWWYVFAESDAEAIERHEELCDWGIENVSEGLLDNIEHEVWRVIDLPVTGAMYTVRAEDLRALERAANSLEETVRDMSRAWGIDLITPDLRVVDPEGNGNLYLSREAMAILTESVRIRQIVRDVLREA